MKTDKEMSEVSSSESGSSYEINQENKSENCLLEMASFDDLVGFQQAVKNGACLDKPDEWYGRIIGTNKMGCEQRTAVMIASLYGSVNVLRFILMQFPHPEALVNQVCGSDRTTSLHCAAASGSPHALQIFHLLLSNGARCDARDALGRRPLDVVEVTPQTEHMKAALEAMLMDCNIGEMSANKAVNAVDAHPTGLQIASDKGIDELLQLGFLLKNEGFVSAKSDAIVSAKSDAIVSAKSDANVSLKREVSVSSSTMRPVSSVESSRSLFLPPSSPKSSDKRSPKVFPPNEKSREFAVDAALPDIKNSLFATDEFRMFSFKVLPCSRAYSHDWTECPFVHPGENARRRDPRKFNYSCAPCPDLRKGCCPKSDSCGYAHGVFECWLHPTQYRTRLCKDGSSCARRVCFFAHSAEELRPPYQSSNFGALYPRETISPPLPPVFPSRMFASPPPFSLCNASVTAPPLSPSLPSHYTSYTNVWSQPSQSSGGLHATRLRTALNLTNTSPEELGCNFDGVLADFSSTEAANSSVGKTGKFSSSSLDLNVHPIDLQDAYSSEHLSSPVSVCHQQNSFQDQPSLPQLPQIRLLNSLIPSSSSQRLAQPQLPVTNHSPMQSSATHKALHNFGSLTLTLPMDSSTASDITANLPQRRATPLSINDRGSWSSRDLSEFVPLSSWSDWGSPSGKPDWGVQGQDLGNLRTSASRDSHGATEEATEPDLSWVQSLVKDSSGDPDDSV